MRSPDGLAGSVALVGVGAFVGAFVGSGVAVGALVGSGVAVGCGVTVGAGVAVGTAGSEAAVIFGEGVALDVTVGSGVSAGAEVTVGVGSASGASVITKVGVSVAGVGTPAGFELQPASKSRESVPNNSAFLIGVFLSFSDSV